MTVKLVRSKDLSACFVVQPPTGSEDICGKVKGREYMQVFFCICGVCNGFVYFVGMWTGNPVFFFVFFISLSIGQAISSWIQRGLLPWSLGR